MDLWADTNDKVQKSNGMDGTGKPEKEKEKDKEINTEDVEMENGNKNEKTGMMIQTRLLQQLV